MGTTLDTDLDREFIETDPTAELDLNGHTNQEAVRTLVEKFSDKFEDDIKEDLQDDLEATAIQEMPSKDRFRSLNDWVTDNPRQPGLEQSSGSQQHYSEADKHFEHYAEIMAIVRSYEKMLDEKYDLAISLKNYPELDPFRLLSISVYGSGSVTLLGTDNEQMPINVYDKIDRISFAITPVLRRNKKKERGKISFFFHDKPN